MLLIFYLTGQECRHNGLSGFSIGSFKDHENMNKQGSEVESSDTQELENTDNVEDMQVSFVET